MIHLQRSGERHVRAPKLPMIVASPLLRQRLKDKVEERVQFRNGDGRASLPALQTTGTWLERLCTNDKVDEALGITIPDAGQSWKPALELRMTAIDIAVERYVKPIEHVWLAKGMSMQTMLDDGPLILLNAWQSRGVHNKTDRLLIALVNRLKEGLLKWEFALEVKKNWYETFYGEEKKLIREMLDQT